MKKNVYICNVKKKKKYNLKKKIMKERTYAVGLRHKTKNEIQGVLVKAKSFNKCVNEVNKVIKNRFNNEYLIKTVTEL